MNINDFTNVKIEIYTPVESVDTIRKALEIAQAGIIGNYDNAYATTEVTGHWRPLSGANPFLGSIGNIATAKEIKIEINCQREFVSDAIKAIRAAHPYEEPLINILPIINFLFE